MNKKIITRISNELGNQLFMYASTFAIAKKLGRELLIDNETSFESNKNISNYGLDNFKISSNIASNIDKFLGLKGYLKRKFLKRMNFILKSKIFYIEPKNFNKITEYNDEFIRMNLSNKVFFEGYFETEKYFLDIKDEIIQEFDFKDKKKFEKMPFFNKIIQKNAVSICLRQNRFIEGKKNFNPKNKLKSDNFRDEQINYINKSITYFQKMIKNPTFYLWSNDLDNIDMSLFNTEIIKVSHDPQSLLNIDKRVFDLFLISQCYHHIVIPSSFNWWGAWLCKKQNKIICRPNNNFFSHFKINNLDFWPSNWVEIS
jgi:hypothetical protein